MTDTPRTLAELLTIFGDGQAANSITPQDMRDFVESLADPIAGGGLQGGVKYPGSASFMLSMHDGDITVPTATPTFLDWVTPGGGMSVDTYDPMGLVQAFSGNGGFDGIPRLPAGIWFLWTVHQWNSGATPGGALNGYPIYVDDDARIAADPVLWDPFFTLVLEDNAAASSVGTAAFQSINTTAIQPVSPAVVAVDSVNSDPGDGLAITTFLFQSSGANRHLLGCLFGGVLLSPIYGDGSIVGEGGAGAPATGLVFEARLATPQSIPSDTTPHPVAFSSIVYDPFGFWDGTWPVIPAGMEGDYLVSCSWAFASNSTGNRVVDIGTDTASDPDGGQWCVPAAASPYVTAQTGSWVSKANEAGFGFYTQAQQNSGGALNLNYCTLTLTRIGA